MVPTRALRRDLRTRVKRRPVPAKGLISRRVASKAAFGRAEALAAGGRVNSLHLLWALLRDPDPAISSLLVAYGLGPDVADRAKAAAEKPFADRLVRRETTASRSRRVETPPARPPADSALARFSSTRLRSDRAFPR